MDQKNEHNGKKLPTALDRETLIKVKGGYRETIGISAGSSFVRWDEIDIRLDGGAGSSMVSAPGGAPSPSQSSGVIKPRP